jgi:hypothetical protein
MSWSILTIRELEDVEDGLLYPIPGEQSNEIEMEEQDGEDAIVMTATALRLQRMKSGADTWTEVMRVRELKASLYITDCRVAIACSKYDKGGGWIGTSPLILPFNAVSKARAAVRRHGKMLVGQIRYPWLGIVGAMEKSGFLSAEELLLRTQDKATNDSLALNITLHKSYPALEMAADIASRAAHYRLKTEPDATPASLEIWNSLRDPPPLRPERGKYASYVLGAYWLAQSSYAYGPPAG